MSDDVPADQSSRVPFPSDQPRVWFLTDANNPIAASIARHLLEHGDSVVAGVLPADYNDAEAHRDDFRELLKEVAIHPDWKARLRVVGFDIRSVAECQSAAAEAVEAFSHIDVLLVCNSEALFGTIEELSQSTRTSGLITDQFATNFFGPVNVIQALLPTFRAQRSGHIVLLTGITAHLGTPGLGIHCAAQWAIEGYCDSLAYEIAPFNIRLSIVQSNIEISILTHKVVVAPALAAYTPDGGNDAPIARKVMRGLLEKLEAVQAFEGEDADDGTGDDGEERGEGAIKGRTIGQRLDTRDEVEVIWPPLPRSFRKGLIEETVWAVLAIGGHENPPARHIVGLEGTASVKEKLRTVSEELEDFVDTSCAVDL